MVLALEEEKGITLHRAISRRTSYGQGEKTGVMSVAVIREEKAKMHKTWCMTRYEKLFEGIKREKINYRHRLTLINADLEKGYQKSLVIELRGNKNKSAQSV